MLVVAALLFALGYWTYSQVERSLREIRASTLQSLLDSGVNALRVWINEEIANAQRLARDARVREGIGALARNPGCSGSARAHSCTEAGGSRRVSRCRSRTRR